MPSNDFRPATSNSGSASSGSTPDDASQIPITPDPTIQLEADDVKEAVVELATDIYSLQNMGSLELKYNLLRNG